MSNRAKMCMGALATIAVWATAFPFSKLALLEVDPVTLSVVRVVGGGLLMLIISIIRGGLHIPSSWREWGLYVMAGITGNILYQVVFNTGLITIPAATSSIIMAMTPMTTALMALVLYKETIRPFGWVFIVTAFIGVSIIIMWNGIINVPVGALWTLFGMILFAGYNCINRDLSMHGHDAITVSTWAMLLGAIMALPWVPSAVETVANASPITWGAMTYLAFLSSALGFVFWSYALEHAEKVTDVTSFMYLSPVVAAIVAAIILGEIPSLGLYIGAPIILCSLYLFNRFR